MLSKNLIGLILLGLFVSQVVIYAAGPTPVNLGSAGTFAILAKTGVSTTSVTSIIGNIGVSPAAATYITGFALITDSSNTFSRSSLITGKIYAADYAVPTPALMTTAISDMQTAYTDAAGRTNPTATELGAGNIGGLTLAPGLYVWSTGVTIPTTLTLSGGPNDVWIFEIAQNLNVGNGVSIILSGGAQAKNVFWQVAGQATLGTTSSFQGIILSKTAIVMNTGATLTGAEYAQSAVTLDAATVTESTGTGASPTTTIVQTTTSTSTLATTTILTNSVSTIVPITSTAPTTSTIVSTTTTASVTTSTPTTTIGGNPSTTTISSPGAQATIIISTSTRTDNGISFTWQGNAFYEIPTGRPDMPQTGMKPGIPYWITNQAFINAVNSWLV